MAVLMADQSTRTATDLNPSPPAVFHDFLGSKAAALHGGSEFPPVSSPCEKQVGSQLDLSVSAISNQFAGSKRNQSDAAVMGSSRAGVPQMTPESSHVLKMLRSASGGERHKISHYDGPLRGAQQIRPGTAFMLQETAGPYAKIVKPERSIPMNVGGGSMQYNAYVGHTTVYQMPSSRFRDSGSGPSVLSQLAADEGSRTGNKGSGILKSINPGSCLASERNSSELVPSGCNVKPATCNSEPESSISPSRHGLTSSSKQMTIIFGGQLHVFDDVHPNKADVIMALAGSNGGSWSTTLPKSSARETTNDSCLPTRENATSAAGDRSLIQKHHDIFSGGGNLFHGLESNNGGRTNKAAGTSAGPANSTLEAKQER